MESNHPTAGLPRPAGFEDRMGHQTLAAPRGRLETVGMTTPPAAGTPLDFLVRRDDHATVEFANAPAADEIELAPGQALLAIDAFALTSNNITYATLGDFMSYWKFFPAPDGWGRIPVWGFADVIRSACDGVTPGDRVYGFLPMSTHLVVQPARVGETGFSDAAPHRAELHPVYNHYLRTASDPGYDAGHEGEIMLLRPLFTTSFLIDDFLDDNARFGATGVVISSASSKTAYGTAFVISRRGDVETIGLTSAGNVDFVQRLGCYDRVLAYDEIATLSVDAPLAYVDLSGDAEVRGALHRHLGDALVYDCAVGMTHHDAMGADPDLPGPAPVMFFAPAQIKKRAGELGPGGLQARVAEAWEQFLGLVTDPDRRLLTVERGAGAVAVKTAYLDALHGRVAPDVGTVLSLRVG